MLTHVEFRSNAFPAYDSEDEEVNPGRYGRRLAEFLAQALRDAGESVREPAAEDWGWVVEIENPGFRLWVGVGNYDQYPDDGFLCFIEPHREFVRRLWKKIPTARRVVEIQEKMNSALQTHPDVRGLKWWTYEEFDNPGG
jgi:hypothetical protein